MTTGIGSAKRTRSARKKTRRSQQPKPPREPRPSTPAPAARPSDTATSPALPTASSDASAASLSSEADQVDQDTARRELEEAARILEPESPAPAAAAPEAPPEVGRLDVELPTSVKRPDPVELGRRLHRVAFGLLAARLGPHWALSRVDEDLVAETSSPLVEYVLDRLGGMTVNIALYVTVLASIVLPRLELEEKHAREQAARAAPKTERPAETAPAPPPPATAPAPASGFTMPGPIKRSEPASGGA